MNIYNYNNSLVNQIRLTNFYIMPSLKCNYHCSYCNHFNDGKFDKKFMLNDNVGMKEFVRLKQLLEYYKHPDIPLKIQISGGEPTLNWNYFYDYVSILSTIPGVEFDIITNLSGNYTNEQFQFLITFFKSIGVSVDGFRDVHDMGRMPGSFDKVMDNLAYLHSLYPAKVKVNAAVTENNVSHLFDTISFFIYLGIGFGYGIDFFTHKINPDAFINQTLEQLEKVISMYGIDALPYPLFDEWFCTSKTQAMTLYPTGEILHCVQYYDKNHVIFDLNKDDFMKIQVENFKRIPPNRIAFEECNTCPAFLFCKNGCYAAFEESKKVFCEIMRGMARMREKYVY